MSNQQVGTVFEKVIQEVCDASVVDFEESGVDQKTLNDLKETWQKKLSSVNVASFPWDPAPPTNPSSRSPSASYRPHASQTLPAQAPPMGAPRIKTEPGSNMPMGMPPMHQVPHQMSGQAPNSQSARDRAASHIQSKFGAAASNSVSQLQAHPHAQQQYPQMHANGQMPHIKQEPGYPSIGHSQNDGAGDSLAEWKAEVARRREAAQNGQGDRMLREHLNQQMLDLEGGGLLRPLSEQKSSTPASRHAVACLKEATALQMSAAAPKVPGQFDGAEDPQEEEDEDAINSDLDDPDDLIADDHDADESEGQVMLCTYDKVQRVKNKWKCTLKDGILTTGGREYVFHKGQGEFEW
ncbi:Transcription factor IIA alpha/beta subunit [Penicillium maclennaniae]|uniref:Transcription factor IIA alpha/beta subunit n=1 Tax=Penicillium maclennaniae TaxID=1343394 RepID=UPI002541D1AB|nr:Transcription factor IIA alpha/beta subunit [Penicillium maclennaniae]KAJ5676775.1 Transcription factor IIA alpha/beta subunit [Penicillium maclennaniae]